MSIPVASMLSNNRVSQTCNGNVANQESDGFLTIATEIIPQVIAGRVAGVTTKDKKHFNAKVPLSQSDDINDIVCNGNGFITLEAEGTKIYKKCFNANVDPSGSMVDENGYKILGIKVPEGANEVTDQLSVENLEPIIMPLTGDRKPTSNIALRGWNLPQGLGVDATRKIGLSAIDGSGESHNFNLVATYQGIDGGTRHKWGLSIEAPQGGSFGDDGAPGTPAAGIKIAGAATKDIFFDGNGNLDPDSKRELDAGLKVELEFGKKADGTAKSIATLEKITLKATDLLNIGGVAQATQPTIENDGQKVSQRDSAFLDSEGYMCIRYDSGETKRVYMLPVASFANPNGLDRVDGVISAFSPTGESGDVNLLLSGGKGGSLLSGVKAGSAVNTIEEMVGAVKASKDYEGAAALLKQENDMLSSLIQMINAA